MALITRVSRLFQADLHAVLDHIEEPQALLRQAVREMEEDLAHDEQRTKVLKHELGQLAIRQSEISQSLADLDDELDVCFEAGKDDLTRTVLRRKLENLHLQKFLSGRQEVQERTFSELRARLEAHRTRLESMRRKAELMAEAGAADSLEDDWCRPDIAVCDEDVEVAFLREKQKRGQS